MIKFSLIIPVYNKEKVIRKTLDSVVNNHNISDENFECILVNESSTDLSGVICKEYASTYDYIKVYDILNDGVKKPSNARNFGKRMAKGEYIMFLDADDLLCDSFMFDAVTFLDENKNFDFLICNRFINDEFYIHDEEQFSFFGPSLSSCVFRKYVTDSLDFENAINEDIVYTKKILLAGYTYYYDCNIYPSYVYVQNSSEMIHDDIKYVEKYSDWICGPAEILQFHPDYKYCISDKNDLIDKSSKKIQNLDVFVTNHCNLNCWSCSSFCPLVEDTTPISVDYIIDELSNVVRFRDDIKCITLLGGEPTLHPNLSKIFYLVRNMFPNNEIKIITNGTTYKNLYKLRDSIIKNNIIVSLSEYPVDNLNEIIRVFKENIPAFNLILNDFAVTYGFCNKHLQEEEHREVDKILQCIKRVFCKRLEGNKIYICHYCSDIKVLKNYFGDEIKINNDDTYIEITYKTTIDEIYKFATEYIPNICYHCADVLQEDTESKMKLLESFPWSKSKKELNEFYKK